MPAASARRTTSVASDSVTDRYRPASGAVPRPVLLTSTWLRPTAVCRPTVEPPYASFAGAAVIAGFPSSRHVRDRTRKRHGAWLRRGQRGLPQPLEWYREHSGGQAWVTPLAHSPDI